MATFAKSSFSANNYYDMARQQRQFPQGKYILRSQKKSPDGQQYGIYLYYYWRGMHVRRSVDMYVAQKDWNQEANGGAGEFRSSCLLEGVDARHRLQNNGLYQAAW